MQPDGSPAADLTERGAAALRAGDRPRARALLTAAVRADPQSAPAWLWLAGALSDPAQQRECLERALRLDPQSAAARRGLADLALAAAARADTGTGGHKDTGTGGRGETGGQGDRGTVGQGDGATLGAASFREHSQTDARPSHPSRTPARPSRPSHPSRTPAPLNPWLAIWASPRQAMAWAVFSRSAAETALLGGLAGLSAMLALAAWRRLADQAGLGGALALALLGGPPLGLAGLVIGGVLLRSAGRWLGGRGSAGALRAGLAWSAAPSLAGLPLWALQAVALPAATFGGGAATRGQAALAGLCGLIHLALAVWSAGLSLVGVAEAHRFSLGRAAATWLLAGLSVLGAGAAVFLGSALLIGLRGG